MAFWLVVFSATVASPAWGDELFAPKHVAQLKSVLSAVMAPDGSKVAYVLAVPRKPLVDDDGPAWTELHVVDSEGKSRPYVAGHVNLGALAWTPDQTGIAFLTKRSGDETESLYVVPIDGGEARRILSHGSDIAEFAFSPDGKEVAFLAAEPRAKEEKDLRAKGFNQEIYEEQWRPLKIWIAKVDSSEAARSIEVEGSASGLSWSPSARQLCVAVAPTPSVDDSYMFRRVRVIDVDTGKVLAAIENPGKLGPVAWSPDGTQVAMISGADLNDPADGRLMVARIGEGTLRDLLPGYDAHVNSFVWLNPKTLLYAADEGVWTSIGSVDADGANRRVLHATGGPIALGLTASKDGARAAFVGNSPQHPPEVFVFATTESDARRVTDSNPWLANMRFAEQEPVTFNARDGLKLEGILVRPLNAQPGQRYPLILTVHGGPEAHVSQGWVTNYSNPGQVGAARGFAIFYPNYRGSTGRGVEFSKLGQADAAGKEFDDLVDAVDHLVAQGLVQKDKVGITGGSYGGYASAWGATYYSDRFAASVMFVGISDNVSKLGTTDIPEEMYLVHHRKRLWDDWQYFSERSPVYHAQKGRTPLLIMHGKSDPRVHPSQSMELFRHMKTLGKAPVRLVLYPEEGHGNRRAASRLDFQLRLLQWMEHYLQGAGGEPPATVLDYSSELDAR